MEAELKILKECIERRNPILLLGAGFSTEASNSKKEKIPLAKDLTGDLYRTVIAPVVDALELNESEEDGLNYAIQYGKLKELCNQIRDFELLDERNAVLKSRMTVQSYNEDIYSKLVTHNWSYIFTLNIDNLVEKIYSDNNISLIKWTSINEKFKEEYDKTLLIKLHGDVDNESTYIFDDTEYRIFSSMENIMIRKFAELYVNHDVIIIGTQFQEEDIEIALNNIFKYGCNNDAFNYFFISPGEFNRKLTNEIRKRDNFHHIRWKTEEFLEFLSCEIKFPNDLRNNLISCGVVDWNVALSSCGISPLDTGIYLGDEVKASDFMYERDISHSKENKQFFEYIDGKTDGIIVIHGEAFVGKTCLAKRYLTEFYKNGYMTFYSPRVDNRLISTIERYLRSINTDAKIAICLENAGDVYKKLTKLIIDNKSYLQKLFIVVTSNEISHRPQSYTFSGISYLDIGLTERIDRQLGENIYDKLNENSYLGKLQTYGNKGDVLKYIRHVNDIIDVLYEANLGRPFAQFFEDWISSRKTNHQMPVFQALTLLASAGVNYCSISKMPQIAMASGVGSFNYTDFRHDFGDYCIEENGYLYIRCTRLFCDLIISQISKDAKVTLVIMLSKMLSKQVRERENTENSVFLEKIIKTKTLFTVFGLKYDEISDLFVNIKDDCKHLSYYWIQLGIAYRNCNEHERAGNAFEYAESTRGNLTYQIAHAKAKNLMDWGLAIQKESTRSFPIFEEGASDMLTLIWSWNYAEAICFSAHAYVDMSLKYYSGAEFTISNSTWLSVIRCFEKYLETVPNGEKLIGNLFKRIVQFCKEKQLALPEMENYRQTLQEKKLFSVRGQDVVDIDQLPSDDKK